MDRSIKFFCTAKQKIALFLLLLAAGPTIAQSDIWHDLLRAMQIADANRARLEFECNHNPLFRTKDQLVAMCEKRNKIPNHVFEEAALPYLKKHLSETMAKRALNQISSQTWQSVGRKITAEIRAGRRDLLTQEDIEFLEQQNQSEVGKALSSFATDKEQGIAVARAILAY